MGATLNDQIGRWIEAEEAGNEAAADRALFEVLRAVPRWPPPPGLADRVMAALGPGAAAWKPFQAWTVRAAIAAGLAVVGLAAATASPASVLGAAGWLVVGAFTAGVSVCASLPGWIRGGAEVWSLLARIGRAGALALGAPEVTAVLAANLAIAAACVLVLRRLLGYREECI